MTAARVCSRNRSPPSSATYPGVRQRGNANMNWEALGAIGEIVGALGVIITLGYLAIQIRHNSKLLKLNNTQQTLNSSRDSFLASISHHNIPMIMAKGEDLTPDEEIAMQYWSNAQMRNFENAYLQYKNGGLDQELIDAIEQKILFAMESEDFLTRWRSSEDQAVASFRTWVNSLLLNNEKDNAG